MIASFFVLLLALKYLFKTNINAMKKVLPAIITVIFFVGSANAQIGKGETMLGGSVIINAYKGEVTDISSIKKVNYYSVSPTIGFGLGHNWVAGAMLGYTFSKHTESGTTYPSKHKSNETSFGLFARKYKPIGERFGVYGQVGAHYGFGKKIEIGYYTGGISSKSKSTSIGVGIKPGISYRISKKCLIESTFGNIGYAQNTDKIDGSPGKTKGSNFSISLTNTFSFAAYFVF